NGLDGKESCEKTGAAWATASAPTRAASVLLNMSSPLLVARPAFPVNYHGGRPVCLVFLWNLDVWYTRHQNIILALPAQLWFTLRRRLRPCPIRTVWRS